MDKKKTSKKRKKSSVQLMPHDPTKTLRNRSGVLQTLLDCLAENDLESFRDILVAHLNVVSKSKLAAETNLGRQTLYDLLDSSKPFNPTLSTLGPILKSLDESED